ncbi:MAG TPA: tetratricopeptide repeat protein [Pyrinomonadaceae bacterium]|nr:tetratricopeptide repeat protein [Pyrinomonadaceae bacterium]
MKRCPECRRDYYDDSLLYCLDDGSALLEGPSSAKEMPTAILRELSEDNIQTKVHPASGSTSSESKDYMGRSGRLLIVGGAAVLAILAVSLAMYFRNEPVSSSAGPIDHNKAYEYFLRGKIKIGSENPEDNDASIKFLEQAVAADPNYAEAYAALAQVYSMKAFLRVSGEEKKRLIENAEVAVERALALDPNLAYGHFARGVILWTPHKRFPHEQAIQSFKRAIALDPNLDDAHHRLALVYFHIGLLDKAKDELDKTMAINPNNTLGRFRFGIVDSYRGRYEEALAAFKTVPRDANPSIVDRNVAEVLFRLGRTEESAAVVEDYFKKYPTDEGGNVTSVKAMLLAQAGKEIEAEETIRRAIEIGQGFGHFHHTASTIGSAYALLNKPDEAVKWLTIAADDGFPCYPYFENDRTLDTIRQDPAFVAFMTKLKAQFEKYNATL